MKKNPLLYIPIFLIFIILVLLIIKYFYYNNKYSQDIKDNYIELTDDRIKELIDESYQYYILKEGKLNVSQDNKIVIDNIEYFQVLLDGVNSVSDISRLVDDLIIYTFVDKRIDEILNKNRKFIDYNNNLYVHMDDSYCDINYSLENSKYKITKVDNSKVDLNFTINETLNYTYPLYNYDGNYKMIDSFYGCYMNIR